MATYTLFWHPRVSSLAPQAVLEEVSVDYDMRRIDVESREQKSEAYLRINPNGLLPALLIEDGSPIFESAGIVMYLADHYPEAGLAPGVSERDRAHYYQWMLYMATTVYPTFSHYYRPHDFTADPTDTQKIKQRAAQDLIPRWQILDDALADSPWLLGERFSACDIYMQMMAIWYDPPQAFLERFKNVARVSAAVAERPSVKKAMTYHPSLN